MFKGKFKGNMLKRLSNRSTFIQSIKNRRGQVALFIALIFQILFLFFAMVINVGLLVHHKINLQNSVDLAAYYGAMKQAEGLNSVAHMNYQIRQSWKLLTWRYRMLGSGGEFHKHPYSKTRRAIIGDPGDMINYADAEQAAFQETPAFCITYIPFKPMPAGENTCKDMAQNRGITVFSPPPIIAAHQVFSSVIKATSEALRDKVVERCKIFGAVNYEMLARFMVTYNLDQSDRMHAIALLSQGMSKSTEDFYDIDGENASGGIEKTLRNNLTSANNNSELKVSIYNSLGSADCGIDKGAGDDQPAKWLTTTKIYPAFAYTDTDCSASKIRTVPRVLTNSAADFPKHLAGLPNEQTVRTLAPWVGYRSDIKDRFNFSLGVEKNPWCMAYVGVSASTVPKIPFSPFGGVKLSARAFYKPFGGRVGPWYKEGWARGSKLSDVGDKIDKNVPPRVADLSELQGLNGDITQLRNRAANYARFVGDIIGLKSLKLIGYYGEAIFNLEPAWRNGSMTSTGGADSATAGSTAPNFADWEHLPFKFSKPSGDILAWDTNGNPSAMRNLELLAILPDTFDMAYYSIEPDYYHTYYPRLTKFFSGPGKALIATGRSFRPDIGYHKGYKAGQYNLDEFSVKDQYNAIKDSGIEERVDSQFTFLSKDWRHMLTGFIPKSLTDYSIDTNRFGKCLDGKEPDPATPGNCIVGGSTGYSVKMVSSKYLGSEIRDLGGKGQSGTILNPPPSDF